MKELLPYHINLVRDVRARELKSERNRRLAVIVGVSCFGFLFLSFLYTGITIWSMENVVRVEQGKLNFLLQEYRKYKSSRQIVDKADVELLDQLQGHGVFWTRKLAAVAKHLPENYSITSFAYVNGNLEVMGYGYVSQRQDQLMILDEYLNHLRADTSFSSVFKTLSLQSSDIINEEGSPRVAFRFLAQSAQKKGPQ